MCQVVKSSRFQDGSEVNIKYTIYLSQFETMSLLAILRKEFGNEIPFTVTENHLVALHRISNSIERSL